MLARVIGANAISKNKNRFELVYEQIDLAISHYLKNLKKIIISEVQIIFIDFQLLTFYF
jgi:hypothetical protein